MLLILLLIAVLVVAGIYKWVSSSLTPEDSDGPSLIDELMNTPEEYQGDVVNVLVCGIRQDLTDMILYVNFDVANRKINMLQIPRDTYPGEEVKTGGTGKINAVANHNGGIG
ncbi:cell envelope-related function transcriptional attenuator common domain protein, partial [gut metagenome]